MMKKNQKSMRKVVCEKPTTKRHIRICAHTNTKGFTLIEILFVIIIIGIIASAVIITISISSKEKARIASGLTFSDSVRAQLSSYEVAWWRFENNYNDTWGGNNGTATINAGGSITYIPNAGINGGAYSFTSAYITSPTLTINTASVTLAAWFNGSSTGTIVALGNGTTVNPALGLESGTGYVVAGKNSGFTTYYTPTTQAYNNNKWHFVVGIFKNNTSPTDEGIKLYVDGTKVATKNQACDLTGNNYFVSGVGSGGHWGYFSGSIDEVQIWNTALTAEQTRRLYVESAPRHGIAMNDN